MDDLISRSWLLSEYDKRHKGPPGGARKLIEEAPPAQPEPLKIDLSGYSEEDWERLKKEWGNTPITVLSAQPKRGRWERHYSRPNVYADLFWHCSECGYRSSDNWADKFNFCPNCGADMRGEQNAER